MFKRCEKGVKCGIESCVWCEYGVCNVDEEECRRDYEFNKKLDEEGK